MMKANKILFLISAVFLLSACGSQPDLMELDEWDLVWISDSSGWGVAKVYAEMVQQDTGKTVNLHDQWLGGLAAADVLHGLQGTPTPDMTLRQNIDLIRDAEIVIIYGNPNGYIDEDWLCTSMLEPNYVDTCTEQGFNDYITGLEDIYETIFELREGKPTIIRTFDAYNPLINEFKEQGVYEECKECWGYYNQAIHQAAATYDIPVAEVGQAWNGPNFDQDPSDLGYVKDGEHPNEEGARVIAQAIRETGYEPVEP